MNALTLIQATVEPAASAVELNIPALKKLWVAQNKNRKAADQDVVGDRFEVRLVGETTVFSAPLADAENGSGLFVLRVAKDGYPLQAAFSLFSYTDDKSDSKRTYIFITQKASAKIFKALQTPAGFHRALMFAESVFAQLVPRCTPKGAPAAACRKAAVKLRQRFQ